MNHSTSATHAACLAVALLTTSCLCKGFTSDLRTASADDKTTLLASAEASRQEHAPVQAQFQSTYQVFEQLVRQEVEDPHAAYDEFVDRIDASAQSAERFEARTATLREDATAFFETWELEIEQFTTPGLRAHSEAMLHDSRESFEKLVMQLDKTHDQMQAVLLVWRDYVLFFSHNLNKHALASLDDQNQDFAAVFEELDEAFAESRARLGRFFQVLGGR